MRVKRVRVETPEGEFDFSCRDPCLPHTKNFCPILNVSVEFSALGNPRRHVFATEKGVLMHIILLVKIVESEVDFRAVRSAGQRLTNLAMQTYCNAWCITPWGHTVFFRPAIHQGVIHPNFL